jgi:hypothetical protein
MPTAFVGLAFSTPGTVLDHTALAAAMLNALVGLALSTPGTVLDHTALASTMPTAFVGLAFSTHGTVLDHTALASTMPTALVVLASKLLTARLNTLSVSTTFGRYIWSIKHTKHLIQRSLLKHLEPTSVVY